MPLVINEVDYDQPGADGASFIEIYNSGTTAVSLAGIYVVLVNGSNNLPYLSIELSSGGASVLGPGEYFVICNATVVVAAGAQAIIVADDFIQNGAPDGIALVDTNTSTLIDSLSYEGSIVADLTSLGLGSSVNLVNGTATTAADENANDVSLIRSPNGRDTNNDASDWSVSFSITPGSSNTPQADIFTAAANVVDLNLFDLSLYDFDQVTDALGGGDEVTLSSTQFVGVAFHGGA
ncbi:MAG: lamin tail domain-containing protein, partial [Hyphomicrobiaceae bacterium]